MEIRTLTRAVTILQFVGSDHGGLSLSKIASGVELSKATTSRFLRALIDLNFLRFDVTSERYFLGQSVLDLGRMYGAHQELRAVARAYLIDLRDRTKETVSLVVTQGSDRATIDVALSPQELRAAPEVGSVKPIYAGAAGKAILAAYSGSDLDQILASLRPVQIAPGTIVNTVAFRRDLLRVRTREYAISVEETFRGQAAAAAAIVLSGWRVVGALNVSGPTARLSRIKLNEYGILVSAAAKELSAKLDATTASRSLAAIRRQVAGAPKGLRRNASGTAPSGWSKSRQHG